MTLQFFSFPFIISKQFNKIGAIGKLTLQTGLPDQARPIFFNLSPTVNAILYIIDLHRKLMWNFHNMENTLPVE